MIMAITMQATRIQGRNAFGTIVTRVSPNAPGRTRTSDHRFRKPVLYPTELRALDEILAGLS